MTDATSVQPSLSEHFQQIESQLSDITNELASLKADTTGIADLVLVATEAARLRADDLDKMVELLSAIKDEVGPVIEAMQNNPMLKMMFGKGKGKPHE